MDREQFRLPYGQQELTASLPAGNLYAYLTPNLVPPCADPVAELRRALQTPIGAPPLRQAVRDVRRVVIIADDLTRLTPVQQMIPLLLDELNRAGLRDEQVTVLIALGTHRPMTEAEIQARFGPTALARIEILNNPWQDLSQMVALGRTANGAPILVSRLAVDADFVIGLGSIVPHHIPGYSGGAKIVQPGISGAVTTGATHYLSTRTRRSYLGSVENPVRAEMETIAGRVGLKAIFNTILDGRGRLVQAVYGHPQRSFRAGVAVAKRVYSVPVPGPADIVVANSYPCELEFWQAHKALYPADLVVKTGGTVIVTTPCPEGVSVSHGGMLEFTGLEPKQIEAAIEDGTIADTVSGALALAWAKMRRRASIALISDGISHEEANALKFAKFASLDEALAAALHRHGLEARVAVLTHAPDMLPVVSHPA
jgi:nickel-dependent lactate racemase